MRYQPTLNLDNSSPALLPILLLTALLLLVSACPFAAAAAADGSTGSGWSTDSVKPDQPLIVVTLPPISQYGRPLVPLAAQALKCAARQQQPVAAAADSAAAEGGLGTSAQLSQALSAAADTLQRAVDGGGSASQPGCVLIDGSLSANDTLLALLSTADSQVLLNWPAESQAAVRTASAAAARIGRYRLLNASFDGNVSKAATTGPRAAGEFSCSVAGTAQPAAGSRSADSLADSAAPQGLPIKGTIAVLPPSADGLLPPTQPVSGFVRAAGTAFQLPDGSPFYFQGTNIYNLLMQCEYSEESVRGMLLELWANGIKVVRTFGFENGYHHGSKPPLQNPIGVFHELALQHYDVAVAIAGEIGICLILPLLNFWPDNGGIGWYVDQTLGPGHDPEEFFLHDAPQAAYRHWVRTLANRRNKVNGRLFKEDPAIFAFEVCNECHTSYNWERNHHLTPGELVYNFSAETAAFMKHELGIQQMIALGSTGFRAKGPHDTDADMSSPWNSWQQDGSMGEDFVRGLSIPEVDFHTIHMFPQNWGAKAQDNGWFLANFISSRANLTHAIAGKPIVLEEAGVQDDWGARDQVLRSYFQAANDAGYAGTLVWQLYGHAVENNMLNGGITSDFKPERYTFLWGQEGTQAVHEQAAVMNAKSAAK